MSRFENLKVKLASSDWLCIKINIELQSEFLIVVVEK